MKTKQDKQEEYKTEREHNNAWSEAIQVKGKYATKLAWGGTLHKGRITYHIIDGEDITLPI